VQETALADMSNNVPPSMPVHREIVDGDSGDDTDRDRTFIPLHDENTTDDEGTLHFLGHSIQILTSLPSG
jgi:hypothetical protein